MAAPREKCLSSYEYIFNPHMLRGRVAFITGGGSGIGFTTAEILMRHGCATVIASRNYNRIKLSSETLRNATGQQCLPIQMDVRKPEEVINTVEKTLSLFKRIDILVNNAAGNFLVPVTGLSFNAYKNVLDIDAMGTFNVSKVIYEKYMQYHGGVIINITATLYYRGQALQAHAGSAKAAIDALTKHFAVEWGPNKVRVIGIAPGLVADTGFASAFGGHTSDAYREYANNVPLQKESSRLDVAHVVLFSVSPAASMITGHTIVADGGAWLTFPSSVYQMTSAGGWPIKSNI